MKKVNHAKLTGDQEWKYEFGNVQNSFSFINKSKQFLGFCSSGVLIVILKIKLLFSETVDYFVEKIQTVCWSQV